jgi:hypothetical protein
MRKAGGGKAKGAAFERVFWARVFTAEHGACWPWLGACSSTGYGVVSRDGQLVHTHRVAWELTHKKKAGRWKVRHTCDNPLCCNPAHLKRGTQKQNVHDSIKRGRAHKHQGPKPWVAGELNAIAKLTDAGVLWARRVVLSGKVSLAAASRKLGVSPGTMHSAVHGNTWRHL